MENPRVFRLLTLLNLVLLVLLMWNQFRPVQASGPPAVLRARKLEIVDDKGMVRSSIQIVPAGPAIDAAGKAVHPEKVYPEQVLFRLIRQDGRPSVKITTAEEGSAMDLGGGIDPTYITINAESGTASMTFTDKDGHRKVIQP
ncbi:MAG TPA: hypothetical protein VMT39_02345 [Candidatus Bathyarchaeia archaeon]|nr:hypothetical protein [Candidatus Bathyarchaeia archaeon]